MACDDINHSWTCGGNHGPMVTREKPAADPAQSAPSADDYEAAKVWWQLQPHNATVALLAEYAALRTAQLEKKYEAELWFFQQEIARLRKEKVAAETRVETVESALRQKEKALTLLLEEFDPFSYTVHGEDSCQWCRRDKPSVDEPWNYKAWRNPEYHDSDCQYLAVAAQTPEEK